MTVGSVCQDARFELSMSLEFAVIPLMLRPRPMEGRL